MQSQSYLGENLHEIYKSPPSEKIAWADLEKISEQIYFFHQHVGTHYDIKLENIVKMTDTAGNTTIQLIDFDLAQSKEDLQKSDKDTKIPGTSFPINSQVIFRSNFTNRQHSSEWSNEEIDAAAADDIRGYIDSAYDMMCHGMLYDSNNKEYPEAMDQVMRARCVIFSLFHQDYPAIADTYDKRYTNFITQHGKIGLMNLHKVGLDDIKNVNRLINLAKTLPAYSIENSEDKVKDKLLYMYKRLQESGKLAEIPASLEAQAEEVHKKIPVSLNLSREDIQLELIQYHLDNPETKDTSNQKLIEEARQTLASRQEDNFSQSLANIKEKDVTLYKKDGKIGLIIDQKNNPEHDHQIEFTSKGSRKVIATQMMLPEKNQRKRLNTRQKQPNFQSPSETAIQKFIKYTENKIQKTPIDARNARVIQIEEMAKNLAGILTIENNNNRLTVHPDLGKNLKEFMTDQSAKSQPSPWEVANKLEEQLEMIHDSGILLYEVKPENIMITKDEQGQVKLQIVGFDGSVDLDDPTTWQHHQSSTGRLTKKTPYLEKSNDDTQYLSSFTYQQALTTLRTINSREQEKIKQAASADDVKGYIDTLRYYIDKLHNDKYSDTTEKNIKAITTAAHAVDFEFHPKYPSLPKDPNSAVYKKFMHRNGASGLMRLQNKGLHDIKNIHRLINLARAFPLLSSREVLDLYSTLKNNRNLSSIPYSLDLEDKHLKLIEIKSYSLIHGGKSIGYSIADVSKFEKLNQKYKGLKISGLLIIESKI